MDRARREDLSRSIERYTEIPQLVLAIAFLVAIALPEIADLGEEVLLTLEAITWLIWAFFALELAVRTYIAPDRRVYLRTHWLDVLTVAIPFLRPLRILAVLGAGLRLWAEARTVLRRRTFSFVGVASLAAVVLASIFVYGAERGGEGPIQSFPDALWWAAATITTVGYGDMYPKTSAGRGVAVLLMLAGISLFGVLTARVAAFFVESDEQDVTLPRLDEILTRLQTLERQNANLSARLASTAASAGQRSSAQSDQKRLDDHVRDSAEVLDVAGER